jgi:hypothetical protein
VAIFIKRVLAVIPQKAGWGKSYCGEGKNGLQFEGLNKYHVNNIQTEDIHEKHSYAHGHEPGDLISFYCSEKYR